MKFEDSAGMNNRCRKLSADDVYRIRAMFDEGVGPVEIKRRLRLDVTAYQISVIGRRRQWQSLPEKGRASA